MALVGSKIDGWVRSLGSRPDRPPFQVMILALMFVVLVLETRRGMR